VTLELRFSRANFYQKSISKFRETIFRLRSRFRIESISILIQSQNRGDQRCGSSKFAFEDDVQLRRSSTSSRLFSIMSIRQKFLNVTENSFSRTIFIYFQIQTRKSRFQHLTLFFNVMRSKRHFYSYVSKSE